MRDNSIEDNRNIVQNCIMSLNKFGDGAGMIDQKCFLIRQYLDYFQLRHARILLDYMEKRILVKDKTNILVTTFNVTLTGCLLIEILELISQ